ncbi:MAG: HNH endonuclease signature motif containing protein, partial [Acidimicrobiales bacterium]
DGACRVPGCERTRWLQAHHLLHWEDGGATDTANLIALCSQHHRQHHRGELGIAGNADDPDGVVFTDGRGRPLARSGTPRPPAELKPTGNWVHPTGERLDLHWVDFMPPPGTPVPAQLVAPIPAQAPPQGNDADYPPLIDLDDPAFDGQRDDVVFAD